MRHLLISSLLSSLLLVSACSEPAPVTPNGGNSLFGSGNVFDASGASSDAGGQPDEATVPDAPDVPATPDAGDCSCAGLTCGSPPGCANVCGTCGSGQVCKSNKCQANCACAGVECGLPAPGCTKSCGDCSDVGVDLICQANQCIDNVKCKCAAGQCGVLPGCTKDCGACGPNQKCTGNKCVAVQPTDDCACGATDKCGPKAPNCEKSCGTCFGNQICEAKKCVTYVDKQLMGFGEPCIPGMTAGPKGGNCPMPGPAAGLFETQNYQKCLDGMCDTTTCSNFVCSKLCVIKVDKVNNATGAAGPDGIEDPGVPSDCDGASDSIVGKQFRCVEETTPFQVQSGNGYSACQPGSTFKKCLRNADCSGDEVCRVFKVSGEESQRCSPRLHNKDGTLGGKGTQWCKVSCGMDADNCTLAVCQNNICTEFGCGDLCDNDADCKMQKQCQGGVCVSTLQACTTDADCPVWTCQEIKLSSAYEKNFKICQPKL
jgi:hypothetical protein